MDHAFFMGKALDLARRALDSGDFPVGCVLVGNGQVLATGLRSGTRRKAPSEVDHAEMNALRRLVEFGIGAGPLTVYSTMEPCLMCFGALILSGVKTIVYAYEDVMGGGTICDLQGLTPLYQNSDIAIVPGVLRDESLCLFKAFFKDPQNIYWKDSLLARYTLEQ